MGCGGGVFVREWKSACALVLILLEQLGSVRSKVGSSVVKAQPNKNSDGLA